jgi:lipopolysaccharide biosynthesis protein
MYYYWFSGRRLLDAPVEGWRRGTNLLPYCLSWANESWTRRWDGKSRQVLIGQTYEPDYEVRLFRDLEPHFRTPHYLKLGERPVLLVHRADLLPDPRRFARIFRELAIGQGMNGIYLIAAETVHNQSPLALGFDAVAEFPPVGAGTLRTALLVSRARVSPAFRGRLLDYRRMARYYCDRREPEYVRHRGVVPSWDNTARRGSRSTIVVNSTPYRYQEWLHEARGKEARRHGDDGFVFINAWNEWAEGAYLEPDSAWGDAYLLATAGNLADDSSDCPQYGGKSRLSLGLVHSMMRCGGADIKNLLHRRQ